jgi:hypothetical protein
VDVAIKESVHEEEANLLQAGNTGDNELATKMKNKRDRLVDKRSLGHRLQGRESREDSCP